MADAIEAMDEVEAEESSGAAEFSPEQRQLHLRMVEALLFATREPLAEQHIAARLPEGVDVSELLRMLKAEYEPRGVNLRERDGRWAFRTAEDLAFLLQEEVVEQKRLSRAALETLAIIAYHQPVTRAEIEEIRGVAISRGTLDVLLEAGWIRLRGRRRTPGRPVTFGTTPEFLDHFDLERIADLPGLADLKAAGLLDAALPAGLEAGIPDDDPNLTDDEDPLEADFLEELAPLQAEEGEEAEGAERA